MRRNITLGLLLLLTATACSKKKDDAEASWSAQTGREFYEGHRKALEDKDVKLLWASFSKRTRQDAINQARNDLETAKKSPKDSTKVLLKYRLETKHLKLSPEEFVLAAMSLWMESPEAQNEKRLYTFVSEKAEGDKIIVKLSHPKGGTEELILVREDGALRYDGSRRDEKVSVARAEKPRQAIKTTLVRIPRGARPVEVKSVVDGDTILLTTGERVRYLGVETPEMEEDPNRRYYKLAKGFNQRGLKGAKVYLEADKEKKDDKGRLLAYVWTRKDGRETMINADLIRSGLATVYIHPPNVRCKAYFVQLQREARLKRVGLWKDYRFGEEKFYLGTLRGRSFHRASCEHIQGRSDLKKYKDQTIPLDQGRSPCRSCKP